MNVKKILVILLAVLLMGAALAEEYVPSHTIIGVQFGCTTDEFVEKAAQIGECEVIHYDFDATRATVKVKQKVSFAGQYANVRANFTNDALNEIIVSFDGYNSKSMTPESVINKGFSDFREIYDYFYTAFGAPDACIYMSSDRKDADGHMLDYSLPLTDGTPDIISVLDIITSGNVPTLSWIMICWDNLQLGVSYSDTHLKNKPSTWYYSCEVTMRDKRAFDVDAETIPISNYFASLEIQ